MAQTFEKNVDYPAGMVPITRAEIPAAHILVVGGKKIGYIQEMTPTQNRPVDPQYEIGSIGIVEGLPKQPSYTFKLSHLKVYTKNLMNIILDLSYNESYGNNVVQNAIKGQMTGDDTGKTNALFSLITHNILPFNIEDWELNYGVDAQGNPLDFTLDPDSKSKIVTTYVGCWFTTLGKTINLSDAKIIESADIFVKDIQTL